MADSSSDRVPKAKKSKTTDSMDSGVLQPTVMAIGNEANSGGRHPAVLTSDANAADRPLCVVDANCGGSHSAVPALDAEILTAVRALNRYPKRGKDKTQNLLACRIAKRWLDLLPSTREKLEALQKCGEEELQGVMVQKLLEELRNFGRQPKQWRKPATPAQEHERLLATKFFKHRGNLSSSQIKELKAIWASNSGGKHPVVTMAHGSSEGGRGIKRQCEEGHAEPNSGGEYSAVTKRMAQASRGDRLQPKRPSQEEHAHMPPRKRMRWKQPAPSGSGQPPANSSRGSTGDGHSAVGRSIRSVSYTHLTLPTTPYV
mgnify:CR=1 FL=1